MRPLMVVVISPPRQLLLGSCQRWKPFDVETLIAKSPVKTFNESVFHGPSGADEAQLHRMLHGPGLQSSTSELAPVVQGNASRG